MSKIRTKAKKAILLPEGLKLIIAVICIILLIYLAVSLYGIFSTKSKLAQARETLKQIADKINGLEEGEQKEYLVTGPKGWVIMSLDDCNGENCIFACPDDYECQPTMCFDKGVYEKLDSKLSIMGYCIESLAVSKICTECFKVDIKNLIILKLGAHVFIGDEYYILIAKALDNALVYEDTETRKTVDKLIEEYLISSDKNLKEKIKININEYFQENSLGVLEKWELKLFYQENEIVKFGHELRARVGGAGTWSLISYPEQWQHTIKKTKKYNEKEYNLKFNYFIRAKK